MARSGRRRRPESEGKGRSKLLLWMTIVGMVSSVVIVSLVAVLIAVLDRSGGEDAVASDALAAGTFSELASDGYVLGNPDAPVTLLEFGDFQ